MSDGSAEATLDGFSVFEVFRSFLAELPCLKYKRVKHLDRFHWLVIRQFFAQIKPSNLVDERLSLLIVHMKQNYLSC